MFLKAELFTYKKAFQGYSSSSKALGIFTTKEATGMFQINNHTPFQVELHPNFDPHGRDFLVVIIKGSYQITPDCKKLSPAEKQVKIQHNDEYYTEAGQSSIKLPSDLAASKPATDIILNGHAYAPQNTPVDQCDVTLSVDNRQMTLRVFGTRFWQKRAKHWSISAPEVFERLPVHYEHAYGGFEQVENEPSAPLDYHPFNPCGKGFYPLDGQPFEGLELPNIENPQCLIRSINDRPKPVGFGAIARDWQPRLALAGTYDSAWQENRMPLLPTDFDACFFNAAHPQLQFSPHLTGTECVTISNASASGLFSFDLPGERISVTARIRGQNKNLVTELDTLLIEPDEQRISITWRCAISCSGKLLYVDSVDIIRGSIHDKG